jgi:beta-mannosidase
VRALNFEGTVLSDVTKSDIKLTPDSSHLIWHEATKTVLDKHKPENTVVECILKGADGQQLSRRLFYLVPPKKLNLSRAKVTFKVEQVSGGYQFTLESDRLAKNVFIQTETMGSWSDNYFDLLPGEHKTVVFKTDQAIPDPPNAFKVKHLAETY